MLIPYQTALQRPKTQNMFFDWPHFRKKREELCHIQQEPSSENIVKKVTCFNRYDQPGGVLHYHMGLTLVCINAFLGLPRKSTHKHIDTREWLFFLASYFAQLYIVHSAIFIIQDYILKRIRQKEKRERLKTLFLILDIFFLLSFFFTFF